eukprot:3921979-Lingulodinium_polyedra.AAC.1
MEPLALEHGKTGDALWAVARKTLMVAREHGHKGISICHYVFDGAPFSCLTRRARQEHMLRAVQRRDKDVAQGQDPKQMLVKEWVVASQCSAHACHNALKWGMRELFNVEDCLKEIWEVFFALSHDSGLQRLHLVPWLEQGIVAFVPATVLPEPEVAYQQWTSLGLPADLVDVVAADWKLFWDGRHLLISD